MSSLHFLHLPKIYIIEILLQINNNEVINIAQLCNTFDISSRSLQRLFKTYIGITPSAYIRLNKIRTI
ncbi:MAG: transcriptional regulator GlxA family with amidase domain [Alteromonadaceae bacterium]|jgi:transcriptional regulator GlxA family with amidase domain